MSPTSQSLLLVAGWLVYFLIHSLLASLPVKNRVASRWPKLLPPYRLLFNLQSLILLLPLFYLIYGRSWVLVWAWQGWSWVFVNTLAVLALVGFVWSMRYYDGAEFIGVRQWRSNNQSVEDQERLHISPMHRFVRHPWYSLGLVLIWTRDMHLGVLISAVMMTLYFVFGSRLEERKLLVYHGERYQHYLSRVPGLIPLPWRFLSRDDAAQLLE